MLAATTLEALYAALPASGYADDALYYGARSRYQLGRAGSDPENHADGAAEEHEDAECQPDARRKRRGSMAAAPAVGCGGVLQRQPVPGTGARLQQGEGCGQQRCRDQSRHSRRSTDVTSRRTHQMPTISSMNLPGSVTRIE